MAVLVQIDVRHERSVPDVDPVSTAPVGELVLDGRQARFLLSVSERGADRLTPVLDMPLSTA